MKSTLIYSVLLLTLAIFSQAVPTELDKRGSRDDKMIGDVKKSMERQGLKVTAVQLKKVVADTEELNVVAVLANNNKGNKRDGHEGYEEHEGHEQHEGYE
ncbi:hypothetical protein GLOIN_2v1803354 [Rhizophagus clarus]|uniref:Uncharacterized protein n=1 Tax=Rhizophagus clarus TaxID=94130 RepID=A0A8H3QC35_9GLOM|nr:hypothetical protein GLOIN_2v1803354 [Rhizophagus clarus]